MESLFTWCAVIGGTIFFVQFVMLLLGLDGGGEVDLDGGVGELAAPSLDAPEADAPVALHDAEVDFDSHPDTFGHTDGWFVGIVSFRSLVAAIAVFGFTGLGAIQDLPPSQAFTVAVLTGLFMMYLVGWGLKKLYQLRSDGTVSIRNALGAIGTVYLTIPAEQTGAGKVTVIVGERTLEYRAVTSGEMLKTGTPIIVTRLVSEDTVEVASQQAVKALQPAKTVSV